MAANVGDELHAMAQARRPSVMVDEKQGLTERDSSLDASTNGDVEPTKEEMATLRRVSGSITWQAMTITFVEFCERFGYYGTTALFTNFIQQPRPFGSRTGNIQNSMACFLASSEDACMQPGALDQGQRAATGLTTFNQFWAYIMPLVGGYVADTYLGRYNTIQGAIGFSVVGHILLVCSALPQMIDKGSSALGLFAVGLVILGIGTGGFKSNVSPLLAEQVQQRRPKIITLSTGERVIQDPQVTISRVFLYFYMMINFGSLAGGIGMVYVERYVGFWLAYLLPTALFLGSPLVLLLCKKYYIVSPPTSSVFGRAIKLFSLAAKGAASPNPIKTYKNLTRDDFWESVKPSRLGSDAPAWMRDIDDNWVDQVARGLNACKVFLWLPLYWLAYNQMTGNLTSQSATMQLGGVPNDLINNLNPITLVLFIPLIDYFFYPFLRKHRIRFTPLKRMAMGFLVAAAAMLASTFIQWQIYSTSPCPASEVSSSADCKSPINVWVQTVPYCLIAFSEVFTSITGLEYAFSKAPENMRGLVMGVNLLMTAFSAALGQALTPLSGDPLLVWNYGIVTVLATFGGIGFWFTWRSLDAREDELNLIGATKYKGRGVLDKGGSAGLNAA
ncbi:hypothetical protein B0A48_07938 [Cryoendolithus antarcticus]|uniref:Peptide transporter PTR2 n=1 Tax=Cryoendolithus antarcticus TaxID=1507870 RepID=A0A1V8T0R6_9PEZI|nr:hypothetical protein B0A48_07938 [Cryoendolithus antarcticus]